MKLTRTGFFTSSAQITHFLSDFQCSTSFSPRSVLLYALSHNAPDIEPTVKQLSSLTQHSIGCLTRPWPRKQRSHPSTFSCSVALFDEQTTTVFSDRKSEKDTIQVGRWHAFRSREKKDDDVKDVETLDSTVDWDKLWRSREVKHTLPPEVAHVDSR